MWSTLIWAVTILIVILIFRIPLEAILSSFANVGNKAKIKYKDITIDLTNNDSSLQFGQQGLSSDKHHELTKAFQSTIITSEEKFIRERLVEAKLTYEQAVDVLINHLANSKLNVTLLIIDKQIYDEQVELLSFLNVQIKSCPESSFMQFFQKWRERASNNDYSFERFLGFLFQHRLITQNIDGYMISILGKSI